MGTPFPFYHAIPAPPERTIIWVDDPRQAPGLGEEKSVSNCKKMATESSSPIAIPGAALVRGRRKQSRSRKDSHPDSATERAHIVYAKNPSVPTMMFEFDDFVYK